NVPPEVNSFVDRSRNIVDRFEERSTHLVRSEIAGFQQDVSFELNLSLDLYLPLIWSRIAGSRDHREKLLWRGARRQDLPVGAVIGNSVAAFGGANDCSALSDNLRRGGHSFHRLIQVLVERISRIRRYHHVERPGHLTHGILCCGGTGSGMFLK